ncbi:MAG: hypothetical protein KC944_20190, partial [Candidatus Omnitrophica bacterium]|nr:hypothetical protein [Candidatus Omnitrophota bacterium]
MLRLIRQTTLLVGFISFALSGQNSWGGADSSTTPSSTGLSTSQTSSTGAKSEAKNYDWLNRR